MDLANFSFLLTPTGQQLLDELAGVPIRPQDHLALASRLRHEVTPGQAHALLETALLRQRAAEKFSRAEEMYFTRTALEQASAEVVSRYRANRFAAAGFLRVADLACSIGGDTLSLAAQSEVIGIDRDPLRLAMARENVRAYARTYRFQPIQADLLALPPLPVDAFFFDPGRRDEQGRRLTSIHTYRPPLALTERWLPRVPHAGVKISPAVNYAELPPEAEVEFISVDGGVREGVLWYGDLRTGRGRQATLLPAGDSLSLADGGDTIVPVTPPGRILYEPDGAVIRAHLVETLARQLGARKIDDRIAYLTADEFVATPFARAFLIEEVMAFHLKRLRKRLRERNVGRVTVKKRGSPLEPEELQRRLRLEGEEEALIFLTQVQGEPVVLLGQALS